MAFRIIERNANLMPTLFCHYSLASKQAGLYSWIMKHHKAVASRKRRPALLLSFLLTTALMPTMVQAQSASAPVTSPAPPPGTPPAPSSSAPSQSQTKPVTTPATPLAPPLAPPTPPLPASVDTSPWLYKGSDIPQDKGWQFGTLQNGLRYAVRKNGVPPGQVAIRVRVDAGSLMEEDSERGFAHFLEHLLFRGSKYVPDGEAKRVWQRLGATFGSDSNAQTSPTQTVYQLDLPNATAAGLDESIKILSGMVREPKLDQRTIDTEKSVVMAEQRESDGPQQRQADASREHVFAGQRLAVRSPIGTPQTIGGAKAAGIQAFHDRWYRPDNVVIIISGDGDPAQYAALVSKYFGDWKADGPAPTVPDFGDPVKGKPVAKAIVEPTQPMVVTYTVARPWRQVTDSIKYTQGLYLDYLANMLINRRLENRARDGGSYLVASVSDDKISRSAHITSVSIVPLNNEWEKALRDVRGVIEDAMKSPPSQADIDREFAVVDSFLTKEVENRQNEAGSKQADDLVNALDIRETVTDPMNQRWLFRSAKELATPKALLETTRKLFSGNTRAFLSSPMPVQNAEKKLEAAATGTIPADSKARLVESKATFDDLPKLGAPGSVTATAKVPVFDMDLMRLSNGMTALVYNSDIEPGKVRVNVRFGGGRKALGPTATNLLWTGPYGLEASGIGKLKQNDIDRITNGRLINLDFNIDDDAFELRSETTPQDLKDQLRLLAAQLSSPAWQPEPVHRIKASEEMGFVSQQGSAMEVIKRQLEGLLHGGDKRWTAPNKAEIDALTPEKFKSFWAPLLANGPVEIQVFGDLRTVDINKLLTETFGALADRPAAIPAANANVLPLTVGKAPVTLFHKGDDNQAAAVIAWPTGGGLAKMQEGRGLDVLAAIFTDRLFDRMRQEQGASYAPQVVSEWPDSLNNGGSLMAVSLLQPDDVAKFFEISRSIAADMAKAPPTEDELQRAVGPIKEQVVRASSGNMFWMLQLEGATTEPQRFDVLRRYLADLANVTPAEIQRMAKQYMTPNGAWTMQVLPEKGPK